MQCVAEYTNVHVGVDYNPTPTPPDRVAPGSHLLRTDDQIRRPEFLFLNKKKNPEGHTQPFLGDKRMEQGPQMTVLRASISPCAHRQAMRLFSV